VKFLSQSLFLARVCAEFHCGLFEFLLFLTERGRRAGARCAVSDVGEERQRFVAPQRGSFPGVSRGGRAPARAAYARLFVELSSLCFGRPRIFRGDYDCEESRPATSLS
jgi:hypothetical protein